MSVVVVVHCGNLPGGFAAGVCLQWRQVSSQCRVSPRCQVVFVFLNFEKKQIPTAAPQDFFPPELRLSGEEVLRFLMLL